MRKFLSHMIAASLIASPLALVSFEAGAKTATQLKHERKGAEAKQKSAQKSAARKAKKK